MQQQSNNNFSKRLNGIPDSWNIEATKNNFVLNTSNIKDIKKIENDIKNEEIKKFVSSKSQYVPENWNLYATYNQSLNTSQNNEGNKSNNKYKKYSTTHENMLNILHYNKIRNQTQQQQADNYYNDLQQNIRRQRINRPQKIESYVKRKTKQINQTYPMKEHDLLTDVAKQIFKPVSSGLGVLERIKQKKEERAQQRAQQKAQIQPTQQFVE